MNLRSDANGRRFSYCTDKNKTFPIEHSQLSKFIAIVCSHSGKTDVSLFEYLNKNSTLRVRFTMGSETDAGIYSALYNIITDTLSSSTSIKDDRYFNAAILTGSEDGEMIVEYRFPAISVIISQFNTIIVPLVQKKINELGSIRVHEVDAFYPIYGYCGLKYKTSMTFGGIQDNFEELFDYKNHSWISLRLVSISAKLFDDKIEDNITSSFMMPFVLSGSYMPLASDITPETTTCTRSHPRSDPPPEGDITSKDPKVIASRLIPMISQERKSDLCSVLAIGKAFYNIYGDDDGFLAWKEWSGIDQHEATDMWECDIRASKFVGHITVRTIAEYARRDNPKAYESWNTMWAADALESCLSKTQISVAQYAYRLYWLDFMFSSERWYQLSGTTLVDGSHGIRMKLTNDLRMKINSVRNTLFGEQFDPNIESENTKKIAEKVGKLESLIASMGQSGFIKGVMDFCKDEFHVTDVQKKIDSNSHIMAWTNCITEAFKGKMYVRDPLLEDYIERRAGTKMPADTFYSMTHPKILELRGWFKKVFPDPELEHYFLKICASFLVGMNTDKKFMVWTGEGDNSKSKILDLIKQVLHQYAIDFPVETLNASSKRGQGSASPELARSKGTHLGAISEPNATDRLDAGIIKRYTGGDTFFARFLHQNGEEIAPSFKLVFMCNKIPNIYGTDKALESRFLCLPFLSKFCDDCPDSEEEQLRQMKFKRDENFDYKIPSFLTPMAWLMKQYYPIYVEEGIRNPPRIVVEVTQKHWEDTDIYRRFISELIVKADGSKLYLRAMYEDGFKPWYKKSGFQIKKIPEIYALLDEMKRLLGKPQGATHYWEGLALKDESQ